MTHYLWSWIRTLGALAPGLLGSADPTGVRERPCVEEAPSRLVPLRPLPKDAPSPAIPGGKGGRHEWVDWRGQRIPLAEPVHDCTFGESADGKILAILAGGLRESLDVYLVDSVGGLLMRLPTYGGHCLPLAFNGGSGSLPALDGQDLVLFAFEREDRVHFRAIDPSGGVHASRELPLSVRGFRASSDPATSKVEVHFDGSDLALRFDHPSAPVLVVEPPVVVFPETALGERVLASVAIQNKGRRAVEVPIDAAGGEFRLETTGRVTIRPGEKADLAISFAPKQAGARKGQLALRGPRTLVIQARGKGREVPAALAKPTERASPPPQPAPGQGRVAWQAAPQPAAPAPVTARPAPKRSERALLSEAEGTLTLRGAPFQTFVLSALEAGRGEHEARTLVGGLQGTLDAEGFARIPIAALGARHERFAVVAFVSTPSGHKVRSEIVEVGPEGSK